MNAFDYITRSVSPKDAPVPTNKARQLLAYLQQPRTLNDVLERFSSDVHWRYALYNLVNRGLVVNLNAYDEWGRKQRRNGLFVAKEYI